MSSSTLKRRGSAIRTMLLHSATFTRDFCDPMYSVCQGALVLYTNGRYWYHDGSGWSPAKGLNSQQWIKLFHTGLPSLDDDQFGIVVGLISDERPLDDVWTREDVRAALNLFVTMHQTEYAQWPEGEVLKPLAKARMLSAKRCKIEDALNENVEHDNKERHLRLNGGMVGRMSRERRRSLIS